MTITIRHTQKCHVTNTQNDVIISWLWQQCKSMTSSKLTESVLENGTNVVNKTQPLIKLMQTLTTLV